MYQCIFFFKLLLGAMLGTTDLTVPNGAGTSPVGKCNIMSVLKNSIRVSVCTVTWKQFFILTPLKKYFWKYKGHNFFNCLVIVESCKFLSGI